MTAYSAFVSFLEHLENPEACQTGIVPWTCPVPYFGRIGSATIATVGLNPSIREFADAAGFELQESTRRFPTLTSLRLQSWAQADAGHVNAIANACRDYFTRNPYQRWFGVLDTVLNHAGHSYYGDHPSACHLDLVPFATRAKWGDLTGRQRRNLLRLASCHLGSILTQTSIRLLVLNGQSVITQLSSISDTVLEATEIDLWRLDGGDRMVRGFAYVGTATQIGGIVLDAPIGVVGFNHNLQSSFGVTRRVIRRIGDWLSSTVRILQ